MQYQYMNNGWVKLHRKVQGSELWNDANAWRVFEWLLMNVDYKTGTATFGRKQICEGTGLNENTVYKVTSRLQTKYQVIDKQSNNHWTTFSVLNWAKYQHQSEEVTGQGGTTDQVRAEQSNTLKEVKNIRNKEIKKEREKENHSLTYLENLPEEDVEYFTVTWDLTRSQLIKKASQLRDYCLAHGKKYKDYKAFLRNAVSRDFKVRPMAQPQVEYDYDENGLARVKAIRAGFAIKDMELRTPMSDFELNERRNLLMKQAEELRN